MISITVTELWRVQEYLEKVNQRGIIWKLRKGDQSFLCVMHHHDLIHIPIKLHEDILNGLQSYGAYKNCLLTDRRHNNTSVFFKTGV